MSAYRADQEAQNWALQEAESGQAAFFTASFLGENEGAVHVEPVLVARLPEALLMALRAQPAVPDKTEVYLRAALGMIELSDGRRLLIPWFGVRLILPQGEARWIATLDPCQTGDQGFATLTRLPDLKRLGLMVFYEHPLTQGRFEFTLPLGPTLRSALGRMLAASRHSDRWTPEEHAGARTLALKDPATHAALQRDLFPDMYPDDPEEISPQ